METKKNTHRKDCFLLPASLIQRHSVIFLFLLAGVLCFGQNRERTYTKEYDLHFHMTDSTALFPWRVNAAYSLFLLPFSVQEKKGDRFLFTLLYPKGHLFVDRLRAELDQRILLPLHQEETGEITFECKTECIDHFLLLLSGISAGEEVLFFDTIRCSPDNALSSAHASIPLDGVELLDIRIYAEGQKDTSAQISFSKLDLTIGRLPIDSFAVRELPPLSLPAKKPKTVPVEKSIGMDFGQIVGIGESVHENSAIRDFAYQFILKQAELHNRKLVLFESSADRFLAYDKYIQDPSFLLDTTDLYLKETHHFAHLLDQLRAYNAGKKGKDRIRIFGIDLNLNETYRDTATRLSNYLTHLNLTLQSSEIDRIAVLLRGEDREKPILYLSEKKDRLQELLTAGTYRYIVHLLNLSNRIGDELTSRNIKRDSTMFENTRFLIDNFGKNTKTTVYGHAVHLNILSTYPAVPCRPLGNYLKDLYKEDYTSLLVLTDKGGAVAGDAHYNRTKKSLLLPPEGSMEHFLSSQGCGSIYIPMTKDFDRLVLSRFKGFQHIMQEFYPSNLYKRHNGIFYIEGKHEEKDY
ncbi:MAG: erythromycin esterase family protein [Mediterranea sp.]|jgi:erythromycin esterase-like protein|nr:erythromycin esterase family protein [Mediterranea sp.]